MTDDDRRVNDKWLAKLDQKLDDHICQNSRDFEDLKEQMKPIKAFYERVQWPMQAIAWSIMVTILAVLSALGHWIFEYVRGTHR